jgi:hypothetical protein
MMPLMLATAAYFAHLVSRRVIRDEILARIPAIGLGSWRYLRRLRLGEFLYVIRLRQTSLSTLANSVFMRRIRELSYRAIDFDRSLEKRTAKSRVYDLLSSDPNATALLALVPSNKLRSAVQAAALVPTTLWFDYPAQLPNLVASGQATLCHNLMSFLAAGFGIEPRGFPPEIRKLWERLESDWSRFNADP